MTDRAAPTLLRKLSLSLFVFVLFFALLEGVLALAGVRPVLRDEDPFVGFASTVPLFTAGTDAEGESVLRTSANKRLFNRQEFPARKAPGTVRVFCLGGSTTFGRPFDDTTSFAAWLRELLPAAAPGTTFEVINAGGTSYASYRVARLMQELVRYEPDLFVVYSGQNEFLEERTYRGLRRTPAAVRALSGVLARTRTWSAIAGMLDRAGLRGGREESGTQLAGEADTLLEHFGPEVYQRDDALRDQIIEHYRVSLERVATLAARAGAGVVYVTPASNLKDCSPFKSEHTPGLDPDSAAAVTKALVQARDHLREERWQQAVDLLDEALRADPRHAELHYRRGRALLALGHSAAAEAAFKRALEEDVCPLRILPRMQDLVAEVARRTGSAHVDFAALVAEDVRRQLGHPIPGDEHFLDHVHPTVATNGLLAVALTSPILAQAGLAERTPTAPTVAAAGERIAARLTPDLRARSLANLARVIAWSGKLEDAVRPAREALAAGSDDPVTTASAASILATWHALRNESAEERHYYGVALAATPGDHELHFRIALRALERQPPEPQLAAAHLVYAAVYWQGSRRDAPHRILAGILGTRGHHAAALSHLREAQAIAPGDPEIAGLLESTTRRVGAAAASIGPPKFTVDKFASGRIRQIVQVRVGETGRTVPDGVWTEWHENGRPARFRLFVAGSPVAHDAAWTAEGSRVLSSRR